GYKHLSITVQEDGQIQQLDEAEAGFRLASISTAPPPRHCGLPSTALSGTLAAAPPPAATAKPKSFWSRNRNTARRYKGAGRRQPTSAASAAATPQRAIRSLKGLLAGIRRATWAIGAIIVLMTIIVLIMLQ